MGAGAGVAEALASVSAGLTVLLEADPGEFSARGVLDVLAELQPQVNRAQAAQVKWVGAAHRSGAVAEDGATSTQAWLRGRLHMGNASVVVKAAQTMARWQRVAAAFAAGEISREHVELIGWVARDLSDEQMEAGAEKLLVERACDLPPGPFA